jgi:aminopeptidase N
VHLIPWQEGKPGEEGKEEVPGFTGDATITLTVNEPTDTITLNALELDIKSAAFNGTPTVEGEGGITYDSKLQTATLR